MMINRNLLLLVVALIATVFSNKIYVQSWSSIRKHDSLSFSSSAVTTTNTRPSSIRWNHLINHGIFPNTYSPIVFHSSSLSSLSLAASKEATASSSCNSCDNQNIENQEKNDDSDSSTRIQPDILKPYLPAMDPTYMNTGMIGQNSFIIERTGEPTLQELSNENILKIVSTQCNDLEVNTLVWKCLGYRFNGDKWNNEHVFPNWKEKHSIPPDFIGMQRIYTPEVDKVSLRANQALVKSIPAEHKQMLKYHLKPLGFKGYQYTELTPNKTRRAQCANWLLFYREQLFGYTVEELRERRRLNQQRQQQEQNQQMQQQNVNENNSQNSNDGGTTSSWTLPVKEVF